jgi:squalene synthase HpnC
VFVQPKQFVASAQAMQAAWSVDRSLAYTRWLARHHYENFHVVSALLPARLHQDFYNVYAFCRWADDLGDEIGDTAESLRLLAWWRGELHAMYAGAAATHPVFVALRQTVTRHDLPAGPFDNLITAFVQDQTVTRYRNWDELDGYCVNSANPVGRLVLMLCGYRDDERYRFSDATCTALQLANFWQDVTLDLGKGRIYLPQELFERHGYTAGELLARQCTPAFRTVMREAVERAQRMFEEGLPLARTLSRRLALDIDLFQRGGLRVLQKIRAQDYDVLSHRPAISRSDRLRLLAGSLWRVGLMRPL